MQLKVAEQAVEAFAQLAQKNNTMIVPGNLTEVSGLIGTAMALMKTPVIRPAEPSRLSERGLARSAKIRRPPERWMSGLSRTPGKRVRAKHPPRVRIPPSPPKHQEIRAFAARLLSYPRAKESGGGQSRPRSGFLLLRGGVPVKVGNEVIGAVGVGGAPGGHLDEQCAVAAIEKH